MVSRFFSLGQESEASQISFPPPEGAPSRKKTKDDKRIEQSFPRVWKPNTSNSRHLRKTTIYQPD